MTLPRDPIRVGAGRSRAASTSLRKSASMPSASLARAQPSNRSRKICMSMVGPAHTVASAWWASSGEFDGFVTSQPRFGSATRVSRKNRAASFIAG